MARAFTEEEKNKIREQLLKEGEEIFAKFGIKKTNIGDITDAVGIGKGSFYIFYDSKEELFMAILNQIMNEMKEHTDYYINQKLKVAKGEIYLLFREIFDFLNARPLLMTFFSDNDSVYYLHRKLPKDLLEKCAKYEEDSFFSLIKVLSDKGLIKKNIDIKFALALLQSINLTYLNRELIEEKNPIAEDLVCKVIDMKLRWFSQWLEEEV